MAYDFVRASSQYLNTTSTPVNSTPLTFFYRFRPVNTTDAQAIVTLQNTNADSRIACAYNPGVSPVRAVQSIIVDNSGTLGTTIINEQTISGSVWYSAGVTWSSLTAGVAYLDGSSANSSLSASGAVTLTSIDQILIATRKVSNTPGVFFDGNLADIALWNVALTDGEIASLAKGFKPTRIRPQSLVFYAPLIRNLQDTRGGRAITNNNAATVADHPRVI
jgi:hypothetical protein